MISLKEAVRPLVYDAIVEKGATAKTGDSEFPPGFQTVNATLNSFSFAEGGGAQ